LSFRRFDEFHPSLAVIGAEVFHSETISVHLATILVRTRASSPRRRQH
jgi:hypothetical protein